MIKSEIFRKGYYGFSLLISIGVLVLGLWVESLIPEGCISDKLRSGARALITIGTIMSVLNLSVFLCSAYCEIEDPEDTSTFMLLLMLVSYIVAIVYLAQTMGGIKGAVFPAPTPNRCTTYNQEKNCEDDKLCEWNKDTELCDYKLKSCIPNNKTILAVLGVLIALVVVMVLITIVFLYYKTKKEKTGPSEKEIADEEVIKEQSIREREEEIKKRRERMKKKKEKSAKERADEFLSKSNIDKKLEKRLELREKKQELENQLNKEMKEVKSTDIDEQDPNLTVEQQDNIADLSQEIGKIDIELDALNEEIRKTKKRKYNPDDSDDDFNPNLSGIFN